MATPHHAPQAAIAMQELAASRVLNPPGMQQAKPIVSDVATSVTADVTATYKEIIKEPIRDWTYKEIIKEPPLDTRKEMVFETIVENQFDPGGILTNPQVWNLPGLMF